MRPGGAPDARIVRVGVPVASPVFQLRHAVGLAYAAASQTSGAAEECAAILSQALRVRLYGG